MDIRQIVGDNIRFIREKKGWVQDDLAITAKVSRTYIGQIERGQKTISITLLDKIAKALRVDFSVLVTKDAYKTIELEKAPQSRNKAMRPRNKAV
jgi:transcriptional regulator with XRE-family HTH domain